VFLDKTLFLLKKNLFSKVFSEIFDPDPQKTLISEKTFENFFFYFISMDFNLII